MIDLKKELGGSALGGQWLVGRTENLPVQPGKGVFEYNGMTLITRNSQNTILAADYPDFYNLSQGYYNDYFYYARYTTGVTAPVYADSHGNTVIAVGATGGISRSGDKGVTWSAISSGVSANLCVIHYNTTNNKWYIPYAANKCLISNDDGLTWVDTTCTGLTWDNTLSFRQPRMESIGNVTIFCNGYSSYRTTNGVTWTAAAVGGVSGGKLTAGNGWFAILHTDSRARASQDGITWLSLNSGNQFLSANSTGFADAYNLSHGVVYTGTRWIIATTDLDDYNWFYDSGVSRNTTSPSTTYTTPAYSVRYYAYSASSSPTSSWSYHTVSYPSVTASNWQWDAGNANWFYEIRSPGFVVGMFSSACDVISLKDKYGADNISSRAPGSFEAWHQSNISGHKLTTLPTSVALSAASPATYIALGDTAQSTTGQNAGITRDGLLWKPGATFLTLSGSGSAPARVLPAYSNVYGGEGVACTRIK